VKLMLLMHNRTKCLLWYCWNNFCSSMVCRWTVGVHTLTEFR